MPQIGKNPYIQIGTVAGEVSPKVLDLLDAKSMGLLGLDLHLFREVQAGGKIQPGAGKEFLPFLQKVDVVKGSLEEVASLSGMNTVQKAVQKIASMGPAIVCATDGANGSFLYTAEEFYKIPAYAVREVDATGAGDVFLSSFLFFYGVKKYDPVTSASLASASASFIVEGKGVSRLSNMEEILSRASTLKASPAD